MFQNGECVEKAYDVLTRLFLYVNDSLTTQQQRSGDNRHVIPSMRRIKQEIQTLRCKFHSLDRSLQASKGFR